MKNSETAPATSPARQQASPGLIVVFGLIPSLAMIVLGLWTRDNNGIVIAVFVTGAIMILRHRTQKWLGTATVALCAVLIGSGLWQHDWWIIATGILMAGAWEFVLRSKVFGLRSQP